MHHMNQLDLVRRSHHNHVRQGGKISDVEAARMSAAISAHQPRAVDSETDGKILDRHVVHNLIVSALQKGWVNGAERPHPLCRKDRRNGYSVLLCYADIEGAIRKSLLELVQTSARRHSRGSGAERCHAIRTRTESSR